MTRSTIIPHSAAVESLEPRLMFAASAPTVGDLAMFITAIPRPGPINAVQIYNARSKQWSITKLSQARNGIATVAAGDFAMFAGGSYVPPGRSLVYSNVVDIYDARSGHWSTAKLSQAREGASAVAVGSKVIFAGGFTRAGFSDSVDIFDVHTGKWSVAKLSQARLSFAAVSVGTKAIFAGGGYPAADGTPTNSDVVDIYDSRTGSWSSAKLSIARSGIAATVVGTRAVFAGGATGLINFIGPLTTNAVDIYDAATGTWSVATLSQPRTLAATTTLGNTALFAGGEVIGGATNAIDIYDGITGAWSKATLSKGRVQLASVSLGKLAIFAGGDLALGTDRVDSVDIYNVATRRWTTGKLSEAREVSAAATVGGTAIFSGGSTDFSISNAVDIFTDPSPAPFLVGGIAGDRKGASITLVNDGDAPLIGPFTVDVYASTRPGLTRHSIKLGSTSVNQNSTVGEAALNYGGFHSPNPSPKTLEPADSISFRAPLTIPKSAAAGEYYLVAVARIGSSSRVVAASIMPTLTIPTASAPRFMQTPIASQMQNFIVPARATLKLPHRG